MEEKKQPQEDFGRKIVPDGETEAQPTVEELRKESEGLKQEIERKETVIVQLKKDIKDLQRRGGSKAEIEALSKKLDEMQDWTAGVMDDLSGRIGGEYTETQGRKTYSQQLQERRATSTPKEDPYVQTILDYLDGEGINPNEEWVEDIVRDSKNLKEAYKSIKGKVKEMSQADLEKSIEEKADKKAEEKLQTALEQKLKDLGLTSEGVKSPSAPQSSFEKLEQDYADGKISYSEYKKARQEQGID